MERADTTDNKPLLFWPLGVVIPWPVTVTSIVAVLFIILYPVHAGRVRCREMAERLTQRLATEVRFSSIQARASANTKVFIRVPDSLDEQDVVDLERIVEAESRGVSYVIFYRGKVLRTSKKPR